MTATIILSMVLGFLVGTYSKLPEKLYKISEWLMSGVMWLLILSMGMSFGVKLEASTFRQIGLQSMIFTIFSGGFSILIVHFISRRRKMEDERI